MATQFDPYGIAPDWAAQGGDVVTAWQRALAKFNLGKNNTLQQYGFNQEGDFSGSGNLNPDGTYASTNLSGGLNAVGSFDQFANKDNKSGFGGFRDELNAENTMLANADNGPNMGYSGGLANQRKAAAQAAVNNRQNQFTQGYNQFAGNFNIAGQDSQAATNTGLSGILRDQTNWNANEAAWRATIPAEVAYTPGVSGGGSTPFHSATQMAQALGYSVNQNKLKNQTGATFGSSGKPVPKARGGHAI